MHMDFSFNYTVMHLLLNVCVTLYNTTTKDYRCQVSIWNSVVHKLTRKHIYIYILSPYYIYLTIKCNCSVRRCWCRIRDSKCFFSPSSCYIVKHPASHTKSPESRRCVQCRNASASHYWLPLSPQPGHGAQCAQPVYSVNTPPALLRRRQHVGHVTGETGSKAQRPTNL